MSAEAGFQARCPREIGVAVGGSSPEELMLTTAELSYLPDRRSAYENLAARTGLDGVKSVMLALDPGGKIWHAARFGRCV